MKKYSKDPSSLNIYDVLDDLKIDFNYFLVNLLCINLGWGFLFFNSNFWINVISCIIINLSWVSILSYIIKHLKYIDNIKRNIKINEEKDDTIKQNIETPKAAS